MQDRDILIRDKYDGKIFPSYLERDIQRIQDGEPLAYVIGWIPFLGLHIDLASHPLIPRPETEWWTGKIIEQIQKRTGRTRVLDICAGSGAIGLAIQKHCSHAQVFFGEIEKNHTECIKKNSELNDCILPTNSIRTSDLFAAFGGEQFDIIATNPPYIPNGRILDASVVTFEPKIALFSGIDGLDTIRRIAHETKQHLTKDGELWMECDTSQCEKVAALLQEGGAKKTIIQNDLYGRPRIVVGYY